MNQSIEEIEELSEEEVEEIFFEPRLEIYIEHYEGIQQFAFLDRRVGYVTAIYDSNFYKIPHRLVPERIETGEIIEGICINCYDSMFYDSSKKSYYCPGCDF